MDALVRDVKAARESWHRENEALDSQLKAVKLQSEKEYSEAQRPRVPREVSEALRGHRLRCEIERAFFFHVTYELLKIRVPEMTEHITQSEH